MKAVAQSKDRTSDLRRAQIADAAMEVFMRYGFARVTMDDIAQAAGISRPALYRDFRNKADIYRAIAASRLEECVAEAERILAGEGPLEGRLAGAINAGILDLMEQISRSPHGAEMLEMKGSMAAEAIDRWRGRMVSAISGAIATEAAARKTDLSERGFSPEILAQTLLDGVEGVKSRAGDPREWREACGKLAALVALAVK